MTVPAVGADGSASSQLGDGRIVSARANAVIPPDASAMPPATILRRENVNIASPGIGVQSPGGSKSIYVTELEPIFQSTSGGFSTLQNGDGVSIEWRAAITPGCDRSRTPVARRPANDEPIRPRSACTVLARSAVSAQAGVPIDHCGEEVNVKTRVPRRNTRFQSSRPPMTRAISRIVKNGISETNMMAHTQNSPFNVSAPR